MWQLTPINDGFLPVQPGSPAPRQVEWACRAEVFDRRTGQTLTYGFPSTVLHLTLDWPPAGLQEGTPQGPPTHGPELPLVRAEQAPTVHHPTPRDPAQPAHVFSHKDVSKGPYSELFQIEPSAAPPGPSNPFAGSR
jgi:hypothetical protein